MKCSICGNTKVVGYRCKCADQEYVVMYFNSYDYSYTREICIDTILEKGIHGQVVYYEEGSPESGLTGVVHIDDPEYERLISELQELREENNRLKLQCQEAKEHFES